MTNDEAIKWFQQSAFYHEKHEPFNMAIKALEQEPRVGRWEVISGNNSRCSICGVYNPPDYFNRPVIYNYCPFCGAKMGGT